MHIDLYIRTCICTYTYTSTYVLILICMHCISTGPVGASGHQIVEIDPFQRRPRCPPGAAGFGLLELGNQGSIGDLLAVVAGLLLRNSNKNYHSTETKLFTIHPYYGNLNLVPG